MSEYAKEVKVGDTTYVVQMVDARSQYQIFQKLAHYGAADLVARLLKADDVGEDVRVAFVQVLMARMPESEQDACYEAALRKTAVKGQSEPVTIDLFTGHIAEYLLLAARAIGVQLGDFSCFRSLKSESTAKAAEENESQTRP